VASLKILFVTPEVDPFVKVGGLADMVGALPKELAALGHDVRVVCPLYGSVKRLGDWRARAEPLGIDVGAETVWARTWETRLPGSAVPAYFLENDAFFGRPGVYGGAHGAYDDNDHRFIVLSRGALTLCLQLDWIPDVIHCHDWTTGWVPVLLNTVLRGSPLGRVATVYTIHNLEYQGYAHPRAVAFARLPASEFRADSLEALGAVNPMKGGLYHATKITTVSPTYAAEIRTPDGGFGLDAVLRFRGADLVGILNGIDAASWNPATDPSLPHHYAPGDLAGKARCKAALQVRLGLSPAPDQPVFGVVARLVSQKGLDLLAAALPRIITTMRVQVALLGSGEEGLENAFRDAAHRYLGRVGVHIGFDGSLARLIQAGSDFFVMPSRSEPCGLTQLYAMRYGAPPVVRATGGLIDTVEQYDEQTGEGLGFRFDQASPGALADTIGWANSTYYDRPAHYARLQDRGMRRDFGWGRSAAGYVDVYRWAVAARNPTAVTLAS
jgi:starch synthase